MESKKKMADSANQRVWFPFPGKKKSEYQVLYLKLYLLAVPIQKKLCNIHKYICKQVNSVQSLSPVWLFATPRSAAPQASLSITNSRSSLKLKSIESVMPSNHYILCRRLLPPSVFPSTRVFSSESALGIRWPEYWSFSFNISPSNEYQDWFPLGWTGWISLQSKGLSKSFPTLQFKSINSSALSFLYSSTLTSIHDYWKTHSFD